MYSSNIPWKFPPPTLKYFDVQNENSTACGFFFFFLTLQKLKLTIKSLKLGSSVLGIFHSPTSYHFGLPNENKTLRAEGWIGSTKQRKLADQECYSEPGDWLKLWSDEYEAALWRWCVTTHHLWPAPPAPARAPSNTCTGNTPLPRTLDIRSRLSPFNAHTLRQELL